MGGNLIPTNFPFPLRGPYETFDKFASATVTAGTESTLIDYTVPQGFNVGYITLFGHGIDDVTVWADSEFRLEIDGIPHKDYGSVQDQLGEFRDPMEIGPVQIQALQRIKVIAANNDSVDHLYAARIRGIFAFGK